MIKIKKVVALVLSLTIVMTAFTLPASAINKDGNETAAPCAIMTFCPVCLGTVTSTTRVPVSDEDVLVAAGECDYLSMSHYHLVETYELYVDCSKCGYFCCDVVQEIYCPWK